jgi:hypothetical protein
MPILAIAGDALVEEVGFLSDRVQDAASGQWSVVSNQQRLAYSHSWGDR